MHTQEELSQQLSCFCWNVFKCDQTWGGEKNGFLFKLKMKHETRKCVTTADERQNYTGNKKKGCAMKILSNQNLWCHLSVNKAGSLTLHTDLQLVVEPLEWPAISEVVLRMPRVGGATPSSAWVRGTELARVDTRSRSGWSSLRLRRRRLRLGSLKLRPLIRLIRLWETTSSKRSRCFLGMKILENIVESETNSALAKKKTLEENKGWEAN